MTDARPRLLQLVTHDKMGGVRTLAQMVEAGLEARGYEVDTLALDAGGGLRGAIGGMTKVARSIASGRYDAVFTYQAAASVFGTALAWMRGIPVRAAHQTAAPEAIRPHWKVLDRLFGATGVYSRIISNSAATTASFGAWPAPYKRRFVLIPHGVTPIPHATDAIDWRRRLDIGEDRLVLVATGRLVDQKNYAVGVRALTLLPEAHLIIAGDGPNHSALKRLASEVQVQDRLHLIGAVARQKLGDVLAAAQIYLFPSVWETFGLAGVEAVIAGLPVVAADLPVLREVLQLPGVPAGFMRFHANDDAESLAREVSALAADYPTEEQRDAVANLHRLHHDPELMIDLYEAFLRASLHPTSA